MSLMKKGVGKSRILLVLIVTGLIQLQGQAADHEDRVQSLMLRGVIVTHDLDASLHFYRDILGQEVVEERQLDAQRSQTYLDVSATAKVVHIIFRGSAEYPGGPVTGGRMSLIGIDDPLRSPAKVARHPARHGDVIFPHRVANLDEIYRRIKTAKLQVLYPPRVSSTGRSRTMMVYDPNGKIVELFELFNTQSTN